MMMLILSFHFRRSTIQPLIYTQISLFLITVLNRIRPNHLIYHSKTLFPIFAKLFTIYISMTLTLHTLFIRFIYHHATSLNILNQIQGYIHSWQTSRDHC